MNRLLLLLVILLSISSKAQIEGQGAYTVLVGAEKNGLVGSFSYDKFTYEGIISIGFQANIEQFKDKKYRDYETDYKANAQMYLATLKYYKLIYHILTPEVKFYGGGGVIGGYNKVDKLKNVEVVERSSMVYGGTVNFQTDWYIASFNRSGFLSEISVITDFSYNYLFKREQGNQVFNLTAGLRFTMN